MKKTTSLILAVVMIITMFSTAALTCSAEEPTPRLSNLNECSLSFVIDSGKAHVAVAYTGMVDTFTQIKATVKIQKRFLMVFWNDVDIGEPNNEWVATSTDSDGCLIGEFDITKSGTYRAVFTIEVYGTGGEVDVIEDTIGCTY